MTSDFSILEFIRLRMHARGITKYSVEPVLVETDDDNVTVDAIGEYYFLTAKTVVASLVVKSDSEIFNKGASYANLNYYAYREHTGSIEISQAAGPISLEFLRVIPE